MNNKLARLITFLKDEDGLTTVEYVIGAGVLVGVVTLVFASMGDRLSDKLDSIIQSVPSS